MRKFLTTGALALLLAAGFTAGSPAPVNAGPITETAGTPIDCVNYINQLGPEFGAIACAAYTANRPYLFVYWATDDMAYYAGYCVDYLDADPVVFAIVCQAALSNGARSIV